MTINGPAVILYCFYIAAAEKKGIDSTKLRGTIQNDILKEYMAQHAWVYPIEPALRLIVDCFEWSAEHVPQWNTISISGYHIREAGATAAQELAFTLADGFTYVERGIARGLDVDKFAPRLSFFWDIHNDFFEEIAKLRAARRIWARHMKDRYGAKDPRSLVMRFHSQTAGVTLTAQQPMNNIVRVAYQAMAAVLGGTQSLHTNSMDETLALPTEESVQVALRTQQVLAYESGAADTVDPFAGSYFIESLTDEIEKRAWELIDKVEQLGGSVQALEFIQREIEESAASYHERYRTGQDIVVGVNKFVTDEIDDVEILRVDPESERRQLERLKRFKESRDVAAVEARLGDLKAVATGDGNLLYPIKDALRDGASIGEVCGAMREVFGEYRGGAFF
jgi:methylmalonyl-CoA mutase N-terminal domain/subunit